MQPLRFNMVHLMVFPGWLFTQELWPELMCRQTNLSLITVHNLMSRHFVLLFYFTRISLFPAWFCGLVEDTWEAWGRQYFTKVATYSQYFHILTLFIDPFTRLSVNFGTLARSLVQKQL